MVIYFDSDNKDAAFYFSAEELFTRYIKSETPVLMLWQTENTVMLGNNQVVSSEIDIDFALEAGIKIVRRSSGGGAIFTDMGTVLYTVIEPLRDEATVHREEVAATVIKALRKMGVPAVREGRNDILVDGKKISGLAQYTLGGHVCTHGSLLFDADLEILTKVLIPNEAKLHPKGITSIRSRVTNIKPHLDDACTVGEFMDLLKNELLFGKDFLFYELSAGDIARIDSIYHEKYANQTWNLDK